MTTMQTSDQIEVAVPSQGFARIHRVVLVHLGQHAQESSGQHRTGGGPDG